MSTKDIVVVTGRIDEQLPRDETVIYTTLCDLKVVRFVSD